MLWGVLLFLYTVMVQDLMYESVDECMSLFRESQHGLRAAEVAHNLTRAALNSTLRSLGEVSVQRSQLEDKLFTSVSRHQKAELRILDLQGEIRALKLARDEVDQLNLALRSECAQKDQIILDLQEAHDLMVCCLGWVALVTSLLYLISLLVTNLFHVSFLFIIFRF